MSYYVVMLHARMMHWFTIFCKKFESVSFLEEYFGFTKTTSTVPTVRYVCTAVLLSAFEVCPSTERETKAPPIKKLLSVQHHLSSINEIARKHT